MKIIVLAIIVSSVVWLVFIKDDSVVLGPGVLAAQDPIQIKITSPEPFLYEGYTITPLATFEIEAKVLSRKNYSHGRESDLSRVDVVLGWGNMSDEDILKDIEISQSGRWYRWNVERFPIASREIETHSANMHLVVSDAHIQDKIDEIRKGDIIQLKGSLIRVDASDDWHWSSSLTREDTGGHACELIWVDEVIIRTF